MKDERRRFFRIADTVGVAYRLLTEDEQANQVAGGNQPVDAFALIANYDARIENLLAPLRIRDPIVSEIVDALNKKLNTIINQLELESRLVQRIACKVQEVNISACGMGLVTAEEYDLDRVLSLDLALRPSSLHIFAYGRIVGVDSLPDEEGFFTRVEFQGMSHHDQELLIQHIVKRQGSIIRGLKESES